MCSTSRLFLRVQVYGNNHSRACLRSDIHLVFAREGRKQVFGMGLENFAALFSFFIVYLSCFMRAPGEIIIYKRCAHAQSTKVADTYSEGRQDVPAILYEDECIDDDASAVNQSDTKPHPARPSEHVRLNPI